MRIAALSDMHGQLPATSEIKPVDAVLIAGDIFPLRTDKNAGESLKWLNTTFFDWIKELPAKKVIVTPGNHDLLFYWNYTGEASFGDMDELIKTAGLKDKLTIAIDKTVDFEDKKIYCTPWVKKVPFWGFSSDNTYINFNEIPDDTDILLCHQPPSIGDTGKIFVGTPDETDYSDVNLKCILLRKKIPIVICGHIHEGQHGGVTEESTTVYNVSLLDEKYKRKFEITYLEV